MRLPQDPITETATELAKSKDYTVEGLLVAIAFLAIIGFVWVLRLYIGQRDKDERRYQQFTEKMLPILVTFKDTTVELKGLIHEWLRSQPPTGRAP